MGHSTIMNVTIINVLHYVRHCRTSDVCTRQISNRRLNTYEKVYVIGFLAKAVVFGQTVHNIWRMRFIWVVELLFNN